ncbi:mitotic spindle checkpoint protein Bub3 [Sporothrix stenoceras]|uniref:Mitotic spindle checkpoint protein Bub3 n=1 Tax=Sporothrix stenoceras TaxID=5173 RepID=A0ABR3YR02_9PEZI
MNVAETDLDTDMSRPQTRRLTRTSSRSTRSGRFSPLLSPPAESSTKLCVPLDDQPSQQDVYDKAPPPGYKRLKKVREPQKHVWSDAYVDYSPGRFYTPRDPSNLGHQQPLFQQLPVQFLGDGFSGDETKTRKTRKRARTDNSSNSAGSSSRKKRKAEAASPILGSLDIVNLSQEERAIDMAATTSIAFAAARAKSKIKDIKTKMIPLRPVLETPPRHIWEFDDKPAPPIKKKRVTDKIEDVIVIPSSCDDSGRVIVIPEDKAVAPRPALPPLREACK